MNSVSLGEARPGRIAYFTAPAQKRKASPSPNARNCTEVFFYSRGRQAPAICFGQRPRPIKMTSKGKSISAQSGWRVMKARAARSIRAC
jgi:hypothetical protein